MRRREFIVGLGGAAVAWPLGAWAQQNERMRRVGVLSNRAETVFGMTPIQELLRDELKKLGWIEGRNLRPDFRFDNGDAAQTRAFAADLVQLAPDVIVATYGVAVRAVQQQTRTIPIVVPGGGDLVGNGTARNPAHPEGNVTGFANAFGSLGGKWLELLKEIAPNMTRVQHMYPPVGPPGASYLQSVETAVQSLGVKVVAIPVSDIDGMKPAIGAFAAEPNGGLLPNPGIAILAPLELLRLAAQSHNTVCRRFTVALSLRPMVG
jgi:putative ABC transport system substrate-binding protein